MGKRSREAAQPVPRKKSDAAGGASTPPPPEADGVRYLRAKVMAPRPGHESACVDISDNFDSRTGRCDAKAVLLKINEAQMWMAPMDI
jgi:hypothetical protein